MPLRFLAFLSIICGIVLTCGFAVPGQEDISETIENSVENFEDKIETTSAKQYWDMRFQLQKIFESEVDEMIRIQDDFERTMVLGAQNLSTKKKLTKEERKRLLSSYREMPKTVEEYKQMSKDIKRADRKTGTPKYDRDEKIVKVPDPRYVLVKYNNPPGTQNIDLRKLRQERQVNSRAVVSPQKDKMAFTSVYYVGYNDKISSEVFYVDLDTSKPPKSRIKSASLANKTPVKLLDSAIKEEYPTLFKTLTILDWSEDGSKLAIKERIGSSTFGIWQTNLWVYDLTDNTTKQLVEVRDSVKYWWKENKNVNIDDYRWDIIPLGWDSVHADRLIVCAYAYTTKKTTMFLGLFSVDSKGQSTEFLSDKPMAVGVSSNGLELKAVYD